MRKVDSLDEQMESRKRVAKLEGAFVDAIVEVEKDNPGLTFIEICKACTELLRRNLNGCE